MTRALWFAGVVLAGCGGSDITLEGIGFDVPVSAYGVVDDPEVRGRCTGRLVEEDVVTVMGESWEELVARVPRTWRMLAPTSGWRVPDDTNVDVSVMSAVVGDELAWTFTGMLQSAPSVILYDDCAPGHEPHYSVGFHAGAVVWSGDHLLPTDVVGFKFFLTPDGEMEWGVGVVTGWFSPSPDQRPTLPMVTCFEGAGEEAESLGFVAKMRSPTWWNPLEQRYAVEARRPACAEVWWAGDLLPASE